MQRLCSERRDTLMMFPAVLILHCRILLSAAQVLLYQTETQSVSMLSKVPCLTLPGCGKGGFLCLQYESLQHCSNG